MSRTQQKPKSQFVCPVCGFLPLELWFKEHKTKNYVKMFGEPEKQTTKLAWVGGLDIWDPFLKGIVT